uniref:Uncharacterized protein n=1 Tax=Anguilla anguilla TaxID=7936 RepID=A0A0E9TH83_ANGAN
MLEGHSVCCFSLSRDVKA